jgi:hypothetical protein
VSGADRYIEEARARKALRGTEVIAPPDRRRILALTAAFTPMVAVAALPLTAGILVVASIVGNVTAGWMAFVVLVAPLVALGYLTARWSMKGDDVLDTTRWRWLPLAVTVVLAGTCLAEIVSGSRTPNPVIVLWFESIVWIVVFLPLATGVWGPARRALWAVGPAVTFVAIVFLATQGLFSLRFALAVSEFDDLAQHVARGGQVADGTRAGGFVVHDVNVGRLAQTGDCDVELWITGWHDEDTRYIAHCPDRPEGGFADFTHLAGDWWQIKGRTPPADL